MTKNKLQKKNFIKRRETALRKGKRFHIENKIRFDDTELYLYYLRNEFKKKNQLKEVLNFKKYVDLLKNSSIKIVLLTFFNSLMKDGFKSIIYKHFFQVFYLIKQFNKEITVMNYIKYIFFKIKPILYYRTKHMGRNNVYVLPWAYKLDHKKYISLSIKWLKNALKMRKEKTLFLRIFFEWEAIRLNNGSTMEQKKEYYKNFFDNKAQIRFIKLLKFQW